MLRTKFMVALLLLVLAVPAFGAATGDPLDSNDGIFDQDSFAEVGCVAFFRYPQCVPCWNSCVFAIVADAYFAGGISWEW